MYALDMTRTNTKEAEYNIIISTPVNKLRSQFTHYEPENLVQVSLCCFKYANLATVYDVHETKRILEGKYHAIHGINVLRIRESEVSADV